MSAPLIGDDSDAHPLFFELKNIRAALARCQDESYAAAIKVQRHSLDNAQSHERVLFLQRENDLLKTELSVLRGTPSKSSPSPESKAHIQELTLSLRRLSHKLTLTEEALLDKTKALLNSQADVVKARTARDVANDLVVELRAMNEAERVNIRDMALRIKKQEEELRMSDVVIGEYAELVRELETGPKIRSDRANHGAEACIRSRSPSTLDYNLSQGRFDLQHVIEGFSSQYNDTLEELEKTVRELGLARSQLDAKQRAEHAIMEDFALTRAELDQLKINDGTVAKMVARYMQFSQSSTNSLLTSLESLKTRHAATITTLSEQNQLLLTQIRSLESQNEHLRFSLDELGGEVLKEKCGRRREIGLRIRMGGREERIAEGLRRWVRQSEEFIKRLDCREITREGEEQQQDDCSLLGLSRDARILLDSLEHGGVDEETAVSLSGRRARELMVCGGVDELLEELRIETERRVVLQIRGNNSVDEVEQEESVSRNRNCVPHGGSSQDVLSSSLVLDEFRGETHRHEKVTLPSPDVGDGCLQSDLSLVEGVVLPQSTQMSRNSRVDVDVVEQELESMERECPFYGEKSSRDSPLCLGHQDTHSGKAVVIGTPSSPNAEDTAQLGLSCVVLPEFTAPKSPSSQHTEGDCDTPDQISFDASRQQKGDDEGLLQHNATHASLMVELSQSTDFTQTANGSSDDSLPSPIETVKAGGSVDLVDSASALPVQHSSDGPEESLYLLLAKLAEVSKRYDVFQREFRECHLALEGLKSSLSSTSISHSSSSNPNVHLLPMESLRPVVARLDDFTEDVRVELEIKIGDEALVVKGYEALLRVPDALSSCTRNDGVSAGVDRDASDTNIELQIKDFVDGTDPRVKKTLEMFKAKLEDIQHDIAVLKRVIHDPESILSEQFPSYSATSMETVEQRRSTSVDTANPEIGGWSPWIRASSRPTIPGFGLTWNIMTSPRSRQSSSQMVLPGDPLDVLALRIATPTFSTNEYGVCGNRSVSPGLISASFGGVVSSSYPTNLSIGSPPSGSRRTSSSMYKLGLGVYGGSENVSRTTSLSTTEGHGVKLDVGKTRNDQDIE